MQFVFQDPYGAFDPKMTLGTSLEAPLRHHGVKDKTQRRERMLAMLERVGLEEAILSRRPQECSGGQLQRMVIARALLLQPTFLICDEPTSALDASIRAQILNLLVELKDQLDLTLVLISHDLRVVRYLCDRVAVMYLGQIVEVAPRDELFTHPRHPYTRVLLAASLAETTDTTGTATRLTGEPPSPIDPPTGCRFHPRCPMAQDICRTTAPELSRPGDDHTVTCHFWDS
jgi:peptide/nickel transport system ATP-binding protein